MENILNLLFVGHIIILLCLTTFYHSSASSQNIIEYLPGFPGKLPFYLETGYIGVGENDVVQLFYYFMKSERNAEEDPLMLWLTGGPCCSGLSAIVLENGPMIFNASACNWHSTTPTFQHNPFSWTKVANIIFLDSPVGAGYSYATNPDYYYINDSTSSCQIYQFLRKWLLDHAEFYNNPLYISGDSYSGKTVPIVVQEIFNGNKDGLEPLMNIQGYVLGNPTTHYKGRIQPRYEFARRASLVSDELYESATINCNGNFEEEDMHDCNCQSNLQAISNCLEPLYYGHVLNPKCISNQTWCQESIYQLLDYWANDKQVQAALYVREGTISYWIRCNRTAAFSSDVQDSFPYHQNFTQELVNISALIYSGDHDLLVSYVDTLNWIKKLDVPIVDDWRPWFVNDQVAGYTTKYSNNHYHLTYATVKGAGHTAPEYKHQECFTMISKWLAMDHL